MTIVYLRRLVKEGPIYIRPIKIIKYYFYIKKSRNLPPGASGSSASPNDVNCEDKRSEVGNEMETSKFGKAPGYLDLIMIF